MAFGSSLGRLLFVFVFLLSAWLEYNDFGLDGGTAAKSLKPKFDVFSKHVSARTGVQIPVVDMKYLVGAAIAMKVVGSLLFILGDSLGAYLLLLQQAIATPILYDFYNHDADQPEFAQLFVKFTQSLALLGALFFFIGLKNSMSRRSRKKAPKSKTK